MGEYTFEAEVWEWPARDNWFLVSLPPEHADAIDAEVPLPAGFGSVPVQVTIGLSTWQTSVFPSQETYVLPVKKAVRKAEGFGKGDVVRVHLTVRTGAVG